MRRSLKQNLYRQLISIASVTIGIIFIGMGILLPKVLYPVYEKSLYQYLKQPLDFINDDIDGKLPKTKSNIIVGYLYVISDNEILASDNLDDIIKASNKQILSKINDEYGKFNYLGKTIYYNTSYNQNIKKISLTDDTYIKEIRQDILYKISPVFLITLLLITILIILWCRRLVNKIEHLKQKVDNLNNDEYIDNYNYQVDDELKLLSDAIDNMKLSLHQQEEYKNQMYQNISHDFKTPLTVIKSYIEAIEDGMLSTEDGRKVIKEQIQKLEEKVHSLLYLNKLTYIKDINHNTNAKTDILKIINSSVEKFKLQTPNIKWYIHINDENTEFKGTEDMWEAIIDNILNNFTRYAKTQIKITIKNQKITFYNDGPTIDPNILNDIFTPYKKGINGQFGLGLSIVQKTISLVGYSITVKNERKGVSFMIK